MSKQFKMWTMISLASVAITLIMGLVSIAYGQITADEYHDKNELKKIQGYCFEHAVRAANGEAVVNDLIKAGLIDSQYSNMSCSNIEQLIQTCSLAFNERFGREPYYAYEFNICPKIENKNKDNNLGPLENQDNNVGPLENFTRTAQNGTQYTCQEGSAGQVLGCSPISNNTTQQIEQDQFNNIMNDVMKRFQERLGLTNMQDIKNAQDQIQAQNNKNPNDIVVHLCIQVDKNSTERVCKNWNNNELSPTIRKILAEETDSSSNLIREWVRDEISKAFNKSQMGK